MSTVLVSLTYSLSHLLTNLGDKMQPCPYKYKYELVRWACDNTKWSTSVINKLTRMQLYAIWFKRGANNGK